MSNSAEETRSIRPDGFDLLYEQGPCLVVVKPGGLATQAPPGIDSLEVRVKEFLRTRDGKTGKVYLGIPHRLDRPVSGVMVLARHVRAARRLAEQFEARTVSKKYWAAVEGEVSPAAGTWTDYLRKIPDAAQVEVVSAEHPDGRLAVLHYRVLASDGRMSWLEIDLETGRMHQIRVQAASRSHPIVGDAQYGAVMPFGPATDDFRQRWIALHARSLEFRHPMTREFVSQTAPLPAAWQALPILDPNAMRQDADRPAAE
jgi:23S rRNA pseudouridine1911/1915/1917 synthase